MALKDGLTRRRVLQLRIALRVGLWLCVLPMRLRLRTLPGLLADEAAQGRVRRPAPPSSERVHTVGVVQRVCRLRIFRAPVFPRPCLRESLALFHVLRSLGYPVCIHVGVRKDGAGLAAHSWVTLDGEPVGSPRCDSLFRTLYSYPAAEPAHM